MLKETRVGVSEPHVVSEHYGPPDGKERGPKEQAAYAAEFDRVMEIFRREYAGFLQVPAHDLLRRRRERVSGHGRDQMGDAVGLG